MPQTQPAIIDRHSSSEMIFFMMGFLLLSLIHALKQ